MNESAIVEELQSLRRRVAQLEAADAIRALATAYAVACDQHDMPALMALFTDDAEFASPSGVMDAATPADIETMFIALFKIRGPAYHWTHDVTVQVLDDDHATGIVYSHAETTPNGVVSLAAMRYADDYRRVDGQWRFARREISFLYYVPAADYTEGLNHTQRFTFGDQRIAADYPESSPSWQAFEREHL